MDKRDYEITVNHWLQHFAAQFPRLMAREAATGERVYGDLLREQAALVGVLAEELDRVQYAGYRR